MSMTPEQDRLLDEAILSTLDTQDSKFGLTPEAISRFVLGFGFRPSRETVERRLRYLSDPEIGFVSHVSSGAGEYHKNLKTWRITAKGTNHLRA
jgi:hypothetical protein